ncbi:hypothetical protein GF325_00885 [Candidatus Bathyarchaeota archaeon]|nr:hypothetical protein [Candidatus Bathyarchaeota archaeon]
MSCPMKFTRHLVPNVFKCLEEENYVMKGENVVQRAKLLFNQQYFGVLVTHHGNYPYPSLVAFSSADDASRIMFATSCNTTKYKNMENDPHVCFFVNNKENVPSDVTTTTTVAAYGKAHLDGNGSNYKIMQRALMERVRTLDEFFRKDTTKFITISVERLQVINNFSNVMEEYFQ